MILERAIYAISERAAATAKLVDEAFAAGLDGSHPVTVQAKMLRQELLEVKADLERELGRHVLDCPWCGKTVHWVSGLGTDVGHWAHRDPAPHDQTVPKVRFLNFRVRVRAADLPSGCCRPARLCR
jgi:hypothetical protein